MLQNALQSALITPEAYNNWTHLTTQRVSTCRAPAEDPRRPGSYDIIHTVTVNSCGKPKGHRSFKKT